MASVIAQTGPGRWSIRLDGREVTVQTPLNLITGQTLRLKLIQQTSHRWEFQIVPAPDAPRQPLPQNSSALMVAFLGQGLPLASERLAAWTRWIKDPGPHDKPAWAASLEARGQDPNSPLSRALEPWMLWLQSVEEGRSEPPPEEALWDEWNLRSPAQGDPWLVLPLHWEYGTRRDSGLLQAHWNPQRQAIDRWNVTAAPAEMPFRLEATVQPRSLELVWRFFRPEDQHRLSRWVERSAEAALTHPDLRVSLRVAGPEPEHRAPVLKGIDVNA